jgi:hypothetical protein
MPERKKPHELATALHTATGWLGPRLPRGAALPSALLTLAQSLAPASSPDAGAPWRAAPDDGGVGLDADARRPDASCSLGYWPEMVPQATGRTASNSERRVRVTRADKAAGTLKPRLHASGRGRRDGPRVGGRTCAGGSS